MPWSVPGRSSSGVIQRRTSTEISAMPYDPGQIILVNYPFTDQTAAKQRPALVVSGRKFNKGQDFVAVPISSRITQDDPFGHIIADTDPHFPKTKLRCSSTVRWAKPMTLSEVVVHRTLGVIPADVLESIRQKMREMLS